ncbi:hypothetical protein [Noviherbaspirillum sedimenti]|uniref:Cell envelope biogenesis protein TolA n=1 Tax=Noviherbaspirillum sedimenti TaxID=2320865 RepID=A0A3A3G7D4_9BURK|nr:hypothetical protein [Noviherbaspirillum sedimenti]RJG03871.1 hypothetical protein D3878_21635 [Noviherbaspirillum sedimenti]
MKKILAGFLFGATSLGLVSIAIGATDEARATYQAEKESASANYKMAREKCNALSGNPKDVCVEEAKAAEKKSKANAEAKYKNTDKERMKARKVAADADYAVAKEKCDAKTGNEKDVCIKEAKAAQTKAKSEAEMSKEVRESKSEAAAETREANYKVALEKCDALSGPAKDACVASAESKYGK